MYNNALKRALGLFPTPCHPLNNLSKKYNKNISIKRDDLTGLACGGNKTRKLEYLLGDALQQNIDTIITAGAIQSNHCQQTVAACNKLGLPCHLVLGGEPPKKATGNYFLDKLANATCHFTGNNRKGEDLEKIVASLTAQNLQPYVIPYGGSNAIGALGFVDALEELLTQHPHATKIIIATSSAGTQAGLSVGKKLLKWSGDIIGIQIDKTELNHLSFLDQLIKLSNDTAQLINCNVEFSAEDFIVNQDYIGEGYGIVGDAEMNAIKTLARLEGIYVDPIYTGRAFAGFLDLLEKNYFSNEDNIIFWHTGGLPALFSLEK